MTNHRHERPRPDHVLPPHLFAIRTARPEQRLMRAVLEDGLSIAVQPPPVRRRGSGLWAETDAWLFSDDEAWPFSFRNICLALGADPFDLREDVLAHRAMAQSARAAA